LSFFDLVEAVVVEALSTASFKMASSTVASPPPPPPKQQQQQPVMSLLEKYSNIHRGIDQAREETDKMRLQIEQTNKGIEGLVQERESMQTETEASQQDQKKLEVETDKTLTSLVQLEQEHAVATSKKQQAKTKMQTAQQIVQDHRRTFLEESRNFRSSCKRLCVRAGLLGLKHAPLQAYIVVKRLDHPILQEVEDQRDDHEDDTAEMNEAKERLESSRESQRQTKQERDKFESRKRILQEKADTRQSRKLQLQSQLDRIQKDIGDMETQVSNLNEQTTEAREMASSYENGEYIYIWSLYRIEDHHFNILLSPFF
jgi:chromosome segregation ATPase